MITKTAIRQFLVDGLFGILTALLLFFLFSLLILIVLLAFDSLNGMIEFLQLYDAGFLVIFALWVIFTTFIGSGIGGRYVQNAITRKEFVISILKVFGISWLSGFSFAFIGSIISVLFVQTDIMSLFLSVFFIFIIFIQLLIPISGCCSVLGFLSLILLVFVIQPEKMLYKKIVSSLASSMMGYGFGFSIFFLAFING